MNSLFRRGARSPVQPDFPLVMRSFARAPPTPLPPLAPMPLPSPREVHLWYVLPDEVQDAALLGHYPDLLSPTEKDGVSHMNGDKLQKGALLARTLVRTTLSRYTNCKVSPKSLKFKKNVFGKPEVDWQDYENWDPPSLHFNISHTSSLIACGVAVNMKIGVDVEEKIRMLRNSITSFAQRYFTPREVEYLLAFSDHEIRRQELIKMWTIKEAYVKALGRGFSAAPFKNFMIQFEPCKDACKRGSTSDVPKIVIRPCRDFEYHSGNWRFGLFELARSHYAAICIEKDDDGNDLEEKPVKLKVWKTVPLVRDICVSETDEVLAISNFS